MRYSRLILKEGKKKKKTMKMCRKNRHLIIHGTALGRSWAHPEWGGMVIREMQVDSPLECNKKSEEEQEMPKAVLRPIREERRVLEGLHSCLLAWSITPDCKISTATAATSETNVWHNTNQQNGKKLCAHIGWDATWEVKWNDNCRQTPVALKDMQVPLSYPKQGGIELWEF